MKKYKLICEYPGSPKLGTETIEKVNFVGEQNPEQYKIATFSFINANQIENQPNFWKEITEKDYEILSYQFGTSSVYSVKRLSDGEVFSIGDKIKIGTISKFHCLSISNTLVELNNFTVEVLEGSTQPFFCIKKAGSKEFEILSFRSNLNNDPDYIWKETLPGSGLWSKMGNLTGPYKYKDLLNNKNYSIYSVKRLSDGEIFTVGDTIEFYSTFPSTWKNLLTAVIEEFDLCDHTIGPSTIMAKKKGAGGFSFELKFLKHQTKVKVVTSEDGVDLFEGDKHWTINEDLSGTPCIETTFKSLQPLDELWFSTKEKAEEYILWYKPCISLKDIEALGTSHCYSNLKNLVREKLEKR